jgi:hypothetical protein
MYIQNYKSVPKKWIKFFSGFPPIVKIKKRHWHRKYGSSSSIHYESYEGYHIRISDHWSKIRTMGPAKNEMQCTLCLVNMTYITYTGNPAAMRVKCGAKQYRFLIGIEI